MSADTVLMPAAEGPPPALQDGTVGHDAVDRFEITARLEASGLSDRSAHRRHGVPDVFALAQSLVQIRPPTQGPEVPVGWFIRRELADAVSRCLVLVLGAVLGGLTATMAAASAREVLVAGVSAWVAGSAISGIVWSHANMGQLGRGVARGSGALLLVAAILGIWMVASIVLPGHDATMAGITLAWCWYSGTVSMLVILGRSRYLLAVLAVVVAASTGVLVLGRGSPAPFVLVMAAVALSLATLALAGHLRTAGGPQAPAGHDWKATVNPAAQAAFLAAALSIALTQLPAWEGTAVIVACVVAAGATDPALVLMRQQLTWSSTRTPLLLHAARNARILAATMSAAMAGVSALIAALIVMFLVETGTSHITVIAAAAFSSLATTSTALNAFGLPRVGVVFAGAACLSGTVWVAVGDVAGLLTVGSFLAAGFVALLARVSDPRAYA